MTMSNHNVKSLDMLIRKEDSVSRRKKKLCSHGLPGLGSSPVRFLTINCEVLGNLSNLRFSFHFQKAFSVCGYKLSRRALFRQQCNTLRQKRKQHEYKLFDILKDLVVDLKCRLILFIYF